MQDITIKVDNTPCAPDIKGLMNWVVWGNREGVMTKVTTKPCQKKLQKK